MKRGRLRVHRGKYSDVPRIAGTNVVSLGTFDGVHRGHLAILQELCEIAARPDRGAPARSVVVTFGLHPRQVLSSGAAPPLITTLEERISLLAATGIDELVVLDFDTGLSRVEYRDFVRELLVGRLGMTHFVLGHDVHFGRDRGGNVASVAGLAEQDGFNLSQVASVRDGEAAISSTRIRSLIEAGAMEDAVRCAGHPIPFSGVVESGRGQGRGLGFPTANLAVDPAKVQCAHGVYAGWARQGGGWAPAVVNIGCAPTLTDGKTPSFEVHLPGLEVDLRGSRLEVGLIARLRGEERFPDVEQLKAAIRNDCRIMAKITASASGFARPECLDRLGDG